MTAAQEKRRNKFLKRKDREKERRKAERLMKELGPIELLPWYYFLPPEPPRR